MKYKRYLAKILKNPGNARCRSCDGKLAINKEKTEFMCITCNKKIFVGKKKGNFYPDKSDEPKILEMIQYRIENKFYKLKNGVEYNPVIRKMMVNDEPVIVSEDNHNKYYQEIRNTLCEMKLQ